MGLATNTNETMTLHYLVIWLTDKDMSTREETPLDLTFNPHKDDAGTKYEAILNAISRVYDVSLERINIINVCPL